MCVCVPASEVWGRALRRGGYGNTSGGYFVMGVYGGETYAWHFGGSHGAYEVCDSYDDMMETGTGSDYGWSSSEGEGESEESL